MYWRGCGAHCDGYGAPGWDVTTSQLAEFVGAPGVDLPVRSECKGVVAAGADLDGGHSAWKPPDLHRYRGIALSLSPSQLAFGVGAPGVDLPVRPYGQGMAAAGADLAESDPPLCRGCQGNPGAAGVRTLGWLHLPTVLTGPSGGQRRVSDDGAVEVIGHFSDEPSVEAVSGTDRVIRSCDPLPRLQGLFRDCRAVLTGIEGDLVFGGLSRVEVRQRGGG